MWSKDLAVLTACCKICRLSIRLSIICSKPPAQQAPCCIKTSLPAMYLTAGMIVKKQHRVVSCCCRPSWSMLEQSSATCRQHRVSTCTKPASDFSLLFRKCQVLLECRQSCWAGGWGMGAALTAWQAWHNKQCKQVSEHIVLLQEFGHMECDHPIGLHWVSRNLIRCRCTLVSHIPFCASDSSLTQAG